MHSKTNEIEDYIVSNRTKLQVAKLSFIVLLLGGFLTWMLDDVQIVYKFKFTWLEWWTLHLAIMLAIIVPFALMPLHKFIQDRKMNKFVWGVKHKIFSSELDKYNTDYRIIINCSLPRPDVKLLQLEKGLVTFVYGDDLIVGTINNVRFRLSEMHANTFFKRYFDGVIIVLVFDHLLSDAAVEQAKMLLPASVKLKHFNNKIYLMAAGEEKLFELTFTVNKLNTEELIREHVFFSEIMTITNTLSLHFQQ